MPLEDLLDPGSYSLSSFMLLLLLSSMLWLLMLMLLSSMLLLLLLVVPEQAYLAMSTYLFSIPRRPHLCFAKVGMSYIVTSAAQHKDSSSLSSE